MILLDILRTVIIGPLELLFEIIYAFACQLTANPGASILFLSLAMNILVLPLYNRADAMQAEQRDMQLRLKPWVTHIKKTFRGDERFMMLQTLYRQNHYKPSDMLKGSISLLLEIPFFLAAYHFLSGLEMLQGVSFGPIPDLGTPDQMLAIGGIRINVLPFLMTGINLLSCAVYTKGSSFKDNLQIYIMALIFLVLLYDSPSGLVFYWTLNNLFSLGKNLFLQMQHRKQVARTAGITASAALSVTGLAGAVYALFFSPMPSLIMRILTAALLQVLQIPAYLMLRKKKPAVSEQKEITGREQASFYGGCLFITVLTGLLIPSAVIGASPAEFIHASTQRSPLLSVVHSLLIAGGTFLLWCGIFYMLAKPAGKKRMGLAVWILSAAALVDYMFFGTDYGNLSSNLRYDHAPVFNMEPLMINLAVLAVLSALAYLIWKKRAELIQMVYIVAGLSVVAMSVFNVNQIRSVAAETVEELNQESGEMPSFTLSRNGKNVVVIMMDRAISSYFPVLMEERPELQQQFAGFTYYPNTISHGGSTNFGSPGLYGGYEYVPEEMNRRKTEKLADKQNEALRVMPVIFDQEGYEVTVCDPSYAGYQWVPDLSIYDDHPDIRTFHTLGKFTLNHGDAREETLLDRNLFCYSLFRTAPLLVQPPLYAHGTYNKLGESGGQICSGLSQASGTSPVFENAYAVLKNFPGMTRITEDAENTFMMISNDTTHSPCLLQAPDYEPSDKVDNRAYDAAHPDRFGPDMPVTTDVQMKHYHANMAGMIQLGRWMDYLRENGVYDNTRIIIVADHGYYLGQRQDMLLDGEDLMRFHPLLLVKDFGSTELTTDHSFMTNADVPTLALEGLVDHPVNPATGKPVTNAAKSAAPQKVILSGEWDTSVNDGTTFLKSDWMSVHDDLFNRENWERVPAPGK